MPPAAAAHAAPTLRAAAPFGLWFGILGTQSLTPPQSPAAAQRKRRARLLQGTRAARLAGTAYESEKRTDRSGAFWGPPALRFAAQFWLGKIPCSAMQKFSAR